MIEIKKDKNNTYCFSLKTISGSTLLTSVSFSNKEEIKKTFLDFNPIAQHENIFERKTNHNGEFLFNLKDRKGNIIGSSQLYSSEAGMENGIKNTKNSLTNIQNWEQL